MELDSDKRATFAARVHAIMEADGRGAYVPVSLVAKACSAALEELPQPEPVPGAAVRFHVTADEMRQAVRQTCGAEWDEILWHELNVVLARRPATDEAAAMRTMLSDLADDLLGMQEMTTPDELVKRLSAHDLAHRRRIAEIESQLAAVTQVCDQLRAELERWKEEAGDCEELRAERELAERNAREWEAREARVTAELERVRAEHEALRAACAAEGVDIEARKNVANSIHGVSDWTARQLTRFYDRVQAALLKPAPAWQHISSDGDSHTFRHPSGETRTLEGFPTAQDAAWALDEPAPAEAEPPREPEVIDLDELVERRERRELAASLLMDPPPESAMVEPTPPGLRPLPEGWTYASEADTLRPNDRHALKPVPASLQPLTARVERLERGLRGIATSYLNELDPKSWIELWDEFLGVLDARNGGGK